MRGVRVVLAVFADGVAGEWAGCFVAARGSRGDLSETGASRYGADDTGIRPALTRWPTPVRPSRSSSAGRFPERASSGLEPGAAQVSGGPQTKTWTTAGRDYEQIRIDMRTLFSHLGITTATAPA